MCSFLCALSSALVLHDCLACSVLCLVCSALRVLFCVLCRACSVLRALSCMPCLTKPCHSSTLSCMIVLCACCLARHGRVVGSHALFQRVARLPCLSPLGCCSVLVFRTSSPDLPPPARSLACAAVVSRRQSWHSPARSLCYLILTSCMSGLRSFFCFQYYSSPCLLLVFLLVFPLLVISSRHAYQ